MHYSTPQELPLFMRGKISAFVCSVLFSFSPNKKKTLRAPFEGFVDPLGLRSDAESCDAGLKPHSFIG